MNKDIDLIVNRIDSMLEKIPESYSTNKQLTIHREFLIESTDYLKNFNHTIAFIGKVGVGKTTAISKLLNLIDNEGKEVLQTGGGRTTICEVEVCESNEVSIVIEPYSNNEVKKYLEEFALYIENKVSKKSITQREEPFTLSSEIERALRNMLELKIRRFTEDGKRKQIDDAVELYNTYSSKYEFHQNLLYRINLMNRNTTELFASTLEAKEWIQSNFKDINNGDNKKVSLPKKIIVNFNENPIRIPKINLSFLDTKGVDETANRQDIENQLKDSRTISILCTSFNDAPDKVSTDILRYMKDSGLTKYISKRVIILVLDKNGEAESIADLEEPDLEEGREIRKEQIEGDLKNSLNLDNIKVIFFNSKENSSEELGSVLTNKLLLLRKEHENQVETVIESLDEIEKQTDTQLSLEALRRVQASISVWLKTAKNIHCNLKKNFSAISETIVSRGTHVSSIRACINRYGQWHNLDYYKILSDASRYQTVKAFDKSKDELSSVISNMLEQKDLHYQKGTLDSIQNILEKRVETIYQRAYDRGKEKYFNNLLNDSDLWLKMKQEWGKGAGYKNRIESHTERWFLNQAYNDFDKQYSKEINKMWQKLLVEINSLIEDE